MDMRFAQFIYVLCLAAVYFGLGVFCAWIGWLLSSIFPTSWAVGAAIFLFGVVWAYDFRAVLWRK